MRHAATTFVTIAFLVLTTALPSNAAEPRRAEAPPLHEDVRSPALHLVAGIFATTVQLSVYGGCLVLGGESSSCIESADHAGRSAVGRPDVD